jgi:D-sedoheptulose 7-phosphate isomerase
VREKVVSAALSAACDSLIAFCGDEAAVGRVEAAVGVLSEALASGGTVFACGNGGSLSAAMHFAEELSGRFRNDRPALRGMAIADPAHLTCVANDYGFEVVFSRFLEAHGRAGDVLVALSTSGRSANVLLAAKEAQRARMNVVALTGNPDCPLAELSTITIAAGSPRYADRSQEIHMVVLHALVEGIEAALFHR